MFTCWSCLRRAAQLDVSSPFLTEIASPALTSTSITTSTTTSTTTSIRNHATIASIQKGHHLRLLKSALESKKELPMNKSEYVRGPSSMSRRNSRARAANRHHLDVQNPDDTTTALIMKYTSDKALATELRWTGGDALKLAKSVLDKLKAGDHLAALELIRLSEKIPGVGGHKGVDSIVSWNHVMDYFMSKSLTREAFKVFNEMKKRGHKPDAHTYTIMLRGYTMNHKKPNAVDEAMKVYDSMWRPESNIKPSIIHSNAIINCLGRGLNMDALWSVAGRLPDRGPGAPDKWTYTTILNTMQACAVRDAGQLAETDGDQEAAAKVMQDAIREGRRLWEDIISRWRSGDVNIDQTLVCAMGRLLLLGQRHDWDDIFSLVEQTMRLPRLSGSLSPRVEDNGGELQTALPQTTPNEDDGVAGLEQLELAVADEATPKPKNEFAVVDVSNRPVRATSDGEMLSPYANVGNNVLSLLIEAAIKLRALSAGKLYWAKLTNPDNQPFVMPDNDNLRSYLRLLRVSRSSKAICDLLRQPLNPALEGIWYGKATFVIAMSTCARDFKNPNAFKYASSLLDLMQSKMDQPDPKIMTMYLSLAMVTTPGISTELRGDFNINQGENNLIRAIQRFNYSDLDYRVIIRNSAESSEHGENQLDLGQKVSDLRKKKPRDEAAHPLPEDLLEFMRTLNSAYDKLLCHRLKMTTQMANAFTIQKRELSQALNVLNPAALPPHRVASDSEEPVDTLANHNKVLESTRYPNKLIKRGAPKVKGPRVVDLDKRHPFLISRGKSNLEEGRPNIDRQSLFPKNAGGYKNSPGCPASSSTPSSSEGWSRAWKKSVREMEKDERRKDWVVM